MAYKRKISYFDLIEDEQKRGNAGFVKWEKYDECHILSVFVSGPGRVSDVEAKVFLEDAMLGILNIRNGRAEGTYLVTKGEKGWTEEIGIVRIVLGENRELLAEFEQREITVAQKEESGSENLAEVVELFEEAQEELEEALSEMGDVQEKENSLENIPVEKEEQRQSPKSWWEQLQETHDPFYPFEKEVECYRIFPRDINLLRAEYHSLQNNQFLLHGYYNYRYLIIFQKKDTENEYWLGVPGIYHEREKMAARMFGFEKYEGTKRDYRTGDLGYYLITVG